MRLAEAAGLRCEDFQIDEDGNISAQIIPHPWRRLKTSQSERTIPLVGSSAWVAKRVLASQRQGGFAFPRYNRTDVTNANSASAASNKWLRAYLPEGTSMHGFRHSMRDRLRAVECPADIVDQIGGWGTVGVGQSYGSGYPVAVLRKYMDKVSNNI
ncbi:tyrosine-type recombinase/integrase [Loktanella gaetbuli]|nr:tyrosine-type recombinase/integrase [Loktanella gaetbuli]